MCDRQFEFQISKSLVFVVFLFHLLFLINEDRETVSSSSPLQAAEIEEVAYVKKIIVTNHSIHILYSRSSKDL